MVCPWAPQDAIWLTLETVEPVFKADAPRIPSPRKTWLCCLFLLGFILDTIALPIASAQSPLVSFDIPAEPLPQALAAFAEATGFEIVADARQAHGRVSSSLAGEMAPREALLKLLAGTGLTVRDYAPGDVKLVLAPISPDQPAFSPTTSTHAGYFAAVQQALLRAICRVRATRPGSYRLAIKLWVQPSGEVAHVKFLDTTGDAARDTALDLAVQRLDIGEPPPPDFQQPITLVILPRAQYADLDCGGVAPSHASN
jgi:hypothetical protein